LPSSPDSKGDQYPPVTDKPVLVLVLLIKKTGLLNLPSIILKSEIPKKSLSRGDIGSDERRNNQRVSHFSRVLKVDFENSSKAKLEFRNGESQGGAL
jgi:hypothetical protein